MAVLRRTASTETTHDLHLDHLGSTDIVTDATGGIVERLSYDPHGLRRASDWQDATGTITPGYTTRGFTGHEHLDSLKLVHMNGRVYDPVIGRFLSPDPAYQNLAGSQALNRYSYVLNNPLSYTDPSGYFFKKIFKAIKRLVSSAAKKVKHAVAKVGTKIKKVLAENEIVRAAVVVGASFFVGAGTLYALGAKTFLSATVSQLTVAGFTSGFVGGFIASGGNLKEAALSAVTAAAFAGVGRALALVTAAPSVEVAAHAVIGGTASELRGGKFATGAISSGVAKGLTPIAASLGGQTQLGQTIAIAVVGGVTSELGGGKFTNGAATAAFAYVFNASANKRPGIGHNNPPEPISGNLLVRALAGISRAIIGAGAILWAYQPGTVADARRLPAFEIRETDGSAVHMYVDTHAGQLEVMTAQSMQGSTLLLEGFHIEGPGAGSISSTMELRSNLRAYGRLNNAEEVVLKGAVRTTGANPGRIPRTLRIRVNE